MVNGELVKFKYPEVVADHFRHKGVGVENHNYLRRDGGNKYQICFESVWGTTWLPI